MPIKRKLYYRFLDNLTALMRRIDPRWTVAITICSDCSQYIDHEDSWEWSGSRAVVTHTICDECFRQHYGGFVNEAV